MDSVKLRNVDQVLASYRPQSNAEDHLADVLANGETLGTLAAGTQGGSACQVGFTGDVAATLAAD